MSGVKVEAGERDRWSAKEYSDAMAYMTAMASTVLRYLAPQPSDEILDIGCGDGKVTAQIAPFCKAIVGLDSSASMIDTARATLAKDFAQSSFHVKDCRRLTADNKDDKLGQWIDNDKKVHQEILQAGRYDKVFSSAAMHWILRDETTRKSYFDDVARLLKPGGTFVFEMGGVHNVAEMHTAFLSVISMKYGFSLEKVRETNPWFFSSEAWMRETLTGAGLEVEKCEIVHVPTKLTPRKSDGSGGLEGWVKLAGSQFLELFEDPDRREACVEDICSVLRDVVEREDGSEWIGYVRLRGVARKP